MRRNLRFSTRDGAWCCVMLGVGEANIPVLGATLAMGDAALGLVSSIPQVCGAAAQLATAPLVRRFASLQRWMVIGALIQAGAFIPMAILAFAGGWPGAGALLFAFATIYWFANLSCGATWNTMISSVVPARARARYFSRRSPILNITQLIAIFAGGWVLESGREHARTLATLGVLLIVALVARAMSAWYLHRHVVGIRIPEGFRQVPWGEAFGRFRHGPGGRVLAYRLAVQLALNVSTPFIVPFLLRRHDLQNDFALYALVMGLLLVGKAVAVPMWGLLAHAHGARMLLRIGGLLIIPIPALWLAGDDIGWFCAVQLFSGAAMGAYELGTFLIMFDTVPEAERTSILAKFNFADNLAIVAGSLIGAAVLRGFGTDGPGYIAAFVGSLALRAAAVALLARVPRETTKHAVEAGASLEVHPLPGAVDQPVLASHQHSRKEAP